MSQQYSLRWNNHQPNFISMFTTLLNTKTLVDVTLAAEGQHLQAHKVVLSACSTYFQALFVDNPSRHPIVILKDVTFSNLRTMVDFMYYGEVNVTEEQLPQVLDTAKVLKIKGLTEMPDSTSLTRQNMTSEFQSSGEVESLRPSASPSSSPYNKKRRRRKSSTGSIGVGSLVLDDTKHEDFGQNSQDIVRAETITLSSLPQQRRMREYDERLEVMETTDEPHNLNVDPMSIDDSVGIAPDYLDSQVDLRLRRTKLFKRQNRVQPEEREIRKQSSEPIPSSIATALSSPTLQKHESYPQYVTIKNRRLKAEQTVGSLLIRTVLDRQPSTSATIPTSQSVTLPVTSTSTSCETVTTDSNAQTTRASHTPAVRSGPPLSCNFCWNTVDECGRILRRKTQYHCPECRTNLCIVPCFHEYHDAADPEAANAR
ncbi:BTB/POZ domain-containing protein 18-like isoform X2 [Pieris brassicae]|uniref:BTB/POZ domain-containing protein 18-like isoform X2 n=1 Tax=Pieris brassicae TaxID=7116 RepID=UPI001E660B80|nr:BTB/POZ domain-containing protein 18-like isoform X2 [Pieris brassicae]